MSTLEEHERTDRPHPVADLLAWQERWDRELGRIQRKLDPFGIGRLFAKVAESWAAHPDRLGSALSAFAADVQLMQTNAWHALFGIKPLKVRAVEEDARFADPAWMQPPFSLIKEFYLLYTHWLQDALFETPGMDPGERRRATFWARQWLNAFAPSNYFLTNPVALAKFGQSGGQSVAAGLSNLLEDLRVGDVQMVDRSAFQVGKNLATTPGEVIFRNRLIELIRYTPRTDKVHAVPLLLVPPWINKFYILDLDAKKSLVRFLLERGFAVIMLSWKNPGADMAETTFDDYMTEGIAAAIDAAAKASGANEVHAVGYCLGGTALAALMAWYGHQGDSPVKNWTLLATLTDFSRPGPIEVFIDETTLGTLEEMMAGQGYLDGREMARSFRLLRPNSLIWQYVVHGYLYGEKPPPFDVLYWNVDATRLPRAMHSYYLREFYVNNRLIEKDALHLAGRPIDLARIRAPLYVVGCEEDHIAPWKATFGIAGRISAPVRYTLSSSGHILGIVNPPVVPPKRSYWTGMAAGESPEEWLKAQTEVKGSWWEDWAAWLAGRCGPLVQPKPLEASGLTRLGDAPGSYVLET